MLCSWVYDPTLHLTSILKLVLSCGWITQFTNLAAIYLTREGNGFMLGELTLFSVWSNKHQGPHCQSKDKAAGPGERTGRGGRGRMSLLAAISHQIGSAVTASAA